jgi:putative Flp pilus-assembly TadE/G-like protein
MLRDRGGSERGSVAIVVALSLTLLLAFAALVVDVGLNWAARTSAQTAADSAALAGASTLLLDGPAAAFETVETFLSNNQVTPPAAGWADDGVVSNGEVVCWTMPNAPPNPPPGPGLNCPDGSNALQVITPPINVQYAFAPILGRASNSIKATAAAGAGPAAPNNCVLCLLEPNLDSALAVTSDGDVDVDGGGIVVNSAHPTAAAVLSGGGDVSANQIRVIGGVDDDPGGGQFSPPPELGGPTVADPLADLPTPDTWAALSCCSGPQVIVSDTTLSQGVFDSISVSGNATLTLEPGVYVLTDPLGLSITGNGRVVGNGVTIYLACSGYPAPCAGPGASLSLALNGHYGASAPTSGKYAGLTIFSDRGNTAPMVVANNAELNLNGALYAASAPLTLTSTLTSSPGLLVNGLLVVGTLLLDGDGSVDVNYNPSVLLPGVGGPVLIR